MNYKYKLSGNKMNKHIEINLQNYMSLKMPEYAILVSGKWGSGKTFFIDNFIKNNKSENINFIKISLFGLKNISEINHKIIFKLLSIKEKGFFGDVANIGVKVLDSFGKKLNLSIQDVPIEQIIKKLKGEFIFIFDDLERTDIKLSELLGYINYFVEQADFKVIILANEDEITKDDKYTEFKEKVIGKTYEVQQKFETVFNNFLDLSIHSKEILEQNSLNIKELYIKSTYNNLRHIRQAVMDFDYFYNLLDNKYKEDSIFINKFIYVFFALSIEKRKGILLEEEFKSHNFISWDFLSEDEEKKEKTEFENILNKYTLAGYDSLLLEINTWINILFKNYLIKEDINKAISQISYFNYETYESWYKLYRYWSLEDEEYTEVLKDVIYKFNNNEYIEHEKLLSVIALLLYLSKENLYNISQDNIIMQAKKNIIDNCQTELWKSKKFAYDNFHDSYHYGGTLYSYYDHKSDNFIKIRKYIEEESLKSFNIGLEIKANDLLLDFKHNNLDNIHQKLNEDFRDIDIFSYVDKCELQNAILTMLHSHLPTLTTILENRYEVWQLTSNYPNLVKEITLWSYINTNILTNVDKHTKPLKYYLISSFTKNYTNKIVNNITKAIEELDMNKNLEIIKI